MRLVHIHQLEIVPKAHMTYILILFLLCTASSQLLHQYTQSPKSSYFQARFRFAKTNGFQNSRSKHKEIGQNIFETQFIQSFEQSNVYIYQNLNLTLPLNNESANITSLGQEISTSNKSGANNDLIPLVTTLNQTLKAPLNNSNIYTNLNQCANNRDQLSILIQTLKIVFLFILLGFYSLDGRVWVGVLIIVLLYQMGWQILLCIFVILAGAIQVFTYFHSRFHTDLSPCKFRYLQDINLTKPGKYNDELCPICLQTLSSELYLENIRLVKNNRIGTIMKTQCNHRFHPSCLRRWMRQRKTCPLDNRSIEKWFE